jgi:hypothetical protein
MLRRTSLRARSLSNTLLGCLQAEAHREHWIGWGTALRKARLKLVAQDRRFRILLKPKALPNLASCVMGAWPWPRCRQ